MRSIQRDRHTERGEGRKGEREKDRVGGEGVRSIQRDRHTERGEGRKGEREKDRGGGEKHTVRQTNRKR